MSSPTRNKLNLWIDKILIYPGMENDGLLRKATVFSVQVFILAMTVLAFFLNVTSLLIYGVILIATGVSSLLFYHFSHKKDIDWVILIGMTTSLFITFFFINRLGGLSSSGGLIMAGPVIVVLSMILHRKSWTLFLLFVFVGLVMSTYVFQSFVTIEPILSEMENLLFFSCNTILLGGLLFSVIVSLFRYRTLMTEARAKKTNRQKEFNRIKIQVYSEMNNAIKSPLYQILNQAELIKSLQAQDAGNKPQQIINDGKFILHLIKQMSTLASIDAAEMKIVKKQSDFIRFTKYIVHEFEKFAESKNIKISFKSNLDQFNLDFDPENITVVLSNILSESILRSKVNGEIIVRVNREQENSFKDLVEIIIEDKGAAITDYQLKLLYSQDQVVIGKNEHNIPFYSSLGFLLSGKLIRLMGGKVFARSKQERGTKFRIHLPVQNAMPFVGYQELINSIELTPNYILVQETKGAEKEDKKTKSREDTQAHNDKLNKVITE